MAYDAKNWVLGQWKANMNDNEKKAYESAKAGRLAQAVKAVKEGAARPGIPVKIGNHTLVLRPSGVTDKGSISYSLSPKTIEFEGQSLRINKLSVSVIGTGGGTGIDWDNLATPETEPTE